MGATFYYIPDFESLVHHGTKGMHWGERRYQNKDGSLTPEGYKHWGVSPTGGKRITSKGRGKNAVKIANAMTKRNKQQQKLDKAVEKAEKSGDKAAIAEAKRNAKAFQDQGKGFVKSMNASLKGTSQEDVKKYVSRNNKIRSTVASYLTGFGGALAVTVATGGTALVPVAIGGMGGMVVGAAGEGIRARQRNKRIRNTIGSLSLTQT